MRKILQDNINARNTQDNCRSLPPNARELALGVRNNEELNNLLSWVTIFQGGMLLNIHQVLFL